MSSHMSHSRIRFQSHSLLPALLHDSCGASHSHGRTRTDRLPCMPSVRKNASPAGTVFVYARRPVRLQERGFLAVVSAVCYHGGRGLWRALSALGCVWRPRWRNQITAETATPKLFYASYSDLQCVS